MSCFGHGNRKKKRTKVKKTVDEEPPLSPNCDVESFSVIVSSLDNMNRKELQRNCKKAGLKANGKNVDMVARLKEYYQELHVQERNNHKKDNVRTLSIECQELDDQSGDIASTTSSNAALVPQEPDPTVQSTPDIGCTMAATLTPLSRCPIDVRQPVTTSSGSSGDVQSTAEEQGSVCEEVACPIAQMDAARTVCTRWCVVEGILKTDEEILWRQIRLKGGQPVVPNRFGKYIKFELTPSGKDAPSCYKDNLICGACVKMNESLKHKRDTSNTAKETSTGADLDCASGFQRCNSVKRKLDQDDSACLVSGSREKEVNENVTKKQRKENVNSSQPGTPANAKVRQKRGENIMLPSNLNKPWKPRKLKASPLIQEDAEFARKVEEILRNTRPGSADEQKQIMSGKTTIVCRSPV